MTCSSRLRWNTRQLIAKSFPGRSVRGLQYKLLKLNDTSLYAKESSCQPWSTEEDSLLTRLRCEENLSIREISKRMPNRSYQSIHHHIRSIDAIPLAKRIDWTRDEDDKLLQLRRSRHSWRDVALQLPGRSVNAVKIRYYRGLRQHEQQRTFSTTHPLTAMSSGLPKSENHPTYSHPACSHLLQHSKELPSSSTGFEVIGRRKLHTTARLGSSRGEGQGVNDSSTFKTRRSAGIAWTEDELAKLIELRRKGLPRHSIAATLGRSYGSVATRLKAWDRSYFRGRKESQISWTEHDKQLLESLHAKGQTWYARDR